MQGRFSKKIGANYQHFPIDNWHNEFKQAKRFNFDAVEWIITDFSNPIFNEEFVNIIKKKMSFNKIKINSISLDVIMNKSLFTIDNNDLLWLLDKLEIVIKIFKVKRISVPIEEESKYNNFLQKNKTLKNLSLILRKLSKKTQICIETDLSPKAIKNIFKQNKFENLGLLLDIGNTRANGYDIEEYLSYFPEKIYSIHIKYRDENFGKTRTLTNLKFYELEHVLKNINKLKNLKDICFQTFRSDNKFISDMNSFIRNYNRYV